MSRGYEKIAETYPQGVLIMTRTKVFLPSIPQKQDDFLKWAEQITHVLDELNLRAEKAAKESVSTRTGYIDLPISVMTYRASRLPDGSFGSTDINPALHYATPTGPELFWVITAVSSAALVSNYWATNFRLPSDYVAETDLTLKLYSLAIQTDNAVPTTHDLDAYAYRSGPGTGKQGFGEEVNNAWVQNADLITTVGPLTVSHELLIGDSEDWPVTAGLLQFVIDGDQANFPLAVNDEMQIEFTSRILSSTGVNAWMMFCNFFVAYTARG